MPPDAGGALTVEGYGGLFAALDKRSHSPQVPNSAQPQMNAAAGLSTTVL